MKFKKKTFGYLLKEVVECESFIIPQQNPCMGFKNVVSSVSRVTLCTTSLQCKQCRKHSISGVSLWSLLYAY